MSDIPHEFDAIARQLAPAHLSRKKGRFVFLLDAPEAEPYPIGSSGWEDARRKAETLLYLTRRRHGISTAPFPPRMAYLERLKLTLKFDSHYDQETIKLLSEETFFTNVLLIDEHYGRARKDAAKLASGLFHVSTLARETWATTDGNPLCTMSRLEVLNTSEIISATIYIGERRGLPRFVRNTDGRRRQLRWVTNARTTVVLGSVRIAGT